MSDRLTFQLHTEAGKFSGRVASCEYDGHGFVVQFKVTSRHWYPAGFQPANLKRVGRNARSKASHAA